jgi:dihydrodipicolinate synthase/N-acetylneuraminate lyase
MVASEDLKARLSQGMVIPACPLALTASRHLDERRQRGLLRYYRAAGAGGVAIGVHTTQFAIRDPKVGLFRPVLEIASEELRSSEVLAIAGICGKTSEALIEATLARDLGFAAGLVSLGALREAPLAELIRHCRAVAEVIPIIGFYLQAQVGGRFLSYRFWREFAEIPKVVAIKIAPFNRYQTLDVIRAVVDAGREDIALYTGNDDHILLDLLTPFRFRVQGRWVERRMVGGLLGHWAFWTHRAVDLHSRCRGLARAGEAAPMELLAEANEVTEANAAVFDATNHFSGCIAGVHEVLRRQGLLAGTWCLDPDERLSAGQAEEIDRVCRQFPHLADDSFVKQHLDEWLRG